MRPWTMLTPWSKKSRDGDRAWMAAENTDEISEPRWATQPRTPPAADCSPASSPAMAASPARSSSPGSDPSAATILPGMVRA